MDKIKNLLFAFFIIFFLVFSFYPTVFELNHANNLADKSREFILEHNYYWPDFNLYLSKIRQGIEGRFTAAEKYTSEIHQGSLIQEFYVVLGWAGRILNLDPNSSYHLGRIILAPLLLLIILQLAKYYFPDVQTRFVLARQTWFDRSFFWQIITFLIVVTSGSFPRFYQDAQGALQVGRFMEWWSNIDAVQRITFIPHILFGQVVTFYLLYQLAIKPFGSSHGKQFSNLTMKQLIFYIILGNLAGLTFPPSLITLNGVILLTILIKFISHKDTWKVAERLLFLISTLPSLLSIFLLTRLTPWSALIDFHRAHPMMIPLDQYVLGTGPIIFLGLLGGIASIIKRERKFQPLILWVIVTFSFASFFSIVRDQSPLRFTQTGLFIPLGILAAYFFYQLMHLSHLRYLSYLLIGLYLLSSLFMLKVSLNWQIDFITQRVNAATPDVPYPPQTMYPLKEWMDGIRWLKNNTSRDDVVLAEITAGNFIPAYSGNTVYFGQSNTVAYDRKEKEVDQFFSGLMSPAQAELFLKNGRIKYIFFSIQEMEKLQKDKLETTYTFIKPVFKNQSVTIYASPTLTSYTPSRCTSLTPGEKLFQPSTILS